MIISSCSEQHEAPLQAATMAGSKVSSIHTHALKTVSAQGLSRYLETGCPNRFHRLLRVQSVVQNTYY